VRQFRQKPESDVICLKETPCSWKPTFANDIIVESQICTQHRETFPSDLNAHRDRARSAARALWREAANLRQSVKKNIFDNTDR
jgi:hypothetical protein